MKSFHYDPLDPGQNILGIYDDVLHSAIPAQIVVVSDTAWLAYLTDPRSWRVDAGGNLVQFTPAGPTAAEQTALFLESVRIEVERRIFAEASQNTQINMAGASAAGLMDAAQQSAFINGLNWVASMRTKGVELATAANTDFANDTHWPGVPADAKALADSF